MPTCQILTECLGNRAVQVGNLISNCSRNLAEGPAANTAGHIKQSYFTLPSPICVSAQRNGWRDGRPPTNCQRAARRNSNVFSFLKHINFQRRVCLIAQRQHLLIFGIIVPALGRGLVREANYDANLELARTMKTPQTGAPRDRLPAVLCDD